MALIDLIAGQQKNVTNVLDQYRKGQVERQQDVAFGQRTQVNDMRINAMQAQAEQAASDKAFQNRMAAEENIATRRKMMEEGTITNPESVAKMTKAYSLVKDKQFQEQGRTNDEILRLYDQYDGANGQEKTLAYDAMIKRVREADSNFEAPSTYQEAESSGWINQNISTLRESSEAWKRSFDERSQRSIEKSRKDTNSINWSRLNQRKEELKIKREELKLIRESKSAIDKEKRLLAQANKERNFKLRERKFKALEVHRKKMLERQGKSGRDLRLKRTLDNVDKFKVGSPNADPLKYKIWKSEAERISSNKGKDPNPSATFKQFLSYTIKGDYGSISKEKAVKKAKELTLEVHPDFDFETMKNKEVESIIKVDKGSTVPPENSTDRKVGQKYIVKGKTLIWTKSGDKYGWAKE